MEKFGSSAKVDHNFKMLTTEQYTVCWDRMYNVGKVFVNTDFDIAVFDSGVHHLTKVKIKVLGKFIVLPPINEFKKFILWDIHRVGFFNKSFTIQINHYWSKSFRYYFDNKVKRGDVNKHERTIDTFFSHECYNNHVDYKIFKFLIELKRSLGYTKLIENND